MTLLKNKALEIGLPCLNLTTKLLNSPLRDGNMFIKLPCLLSAIIENILDSFKTFKVLTPSCIDCILHTEPLAPRMLMWEPKGVTSLISLYLTNYRPLTLIGVIILTIQCDAIK